MTLSKSKSITLSQIYEYLLICNKNTQRGHHWQVTFYVKNRTKIPNSFDEKNTMQIFCIIACPKDQQLYYHWKDQQIYYRWKDLEIVFNLRGNWTF